MQKNAQVFLLKHHLKLFLHMCGTSGSKNKLVVK